MDGRGSVSFARMTLAAALALSAPVCSAVAADPPAWRFVEAPLAGGSGTRPSIVYQGERDPRFTMRVECGRGGPSFYLNVSSPDPQLRQSRVDTDIRVEFKQSDATSRAGGTAPAVMVTGRVTQGYLAGPNLVGIGIGLDEGSKLAEFLGLERTRFVRVVAVDTAGRLEIAGMRAALASLKRACGS
jgi:hypothetical protein